MRALFIWQLQLPLTVPAAVTISDSLIIPLSLSLSLSISFPLSGLASCPSAVTVTVNVAIHIKIIVCRRTFTTRNGSPGNPGDAAADFCRRFDCHKMILKMQFGQKCARLLPRSLGLSNGIATLSATSLPSSPLLHSPLLLPLKRYALGNTHLQIAFPSGCPVSSP